MAATRTDPRQPVGALDAGLDRAQHRPDARAAAQPRRLAAQRRRSRDVLGLPTVWVPHSYPGCAQHAPDEHLPTALVRESLQLMAGLWWDLGEPGTPWR